MKFLLMNKTKIPAEKIRWCIFVSAGLLLVLFVILMGMLRLALPYLSDYEKDIEQLLSQELSREVLVDKIDADWHWFSPRLKLINVKIKNANGKSLLVRLEEVSFEFGVLHNLINLSFEPTVITLTGGRLFVKKDQQGRFFIQSNPVNFALPGINDKQSGFVHELSKQLINKEIRLQDMQVEWLDQHYSSKSQFFNNVNSIIKISEDQYQFLIEAKAPAKLAKNITVKTEFERNSDDKKIQSRIYIKSEQLRSDYLVKYLPELNFNIDTVVDTEIWMSLQGDQLENIAGVVATKKLKLSSEKQDNKMGWIAEKLETEFSLKKKDNEWQLVFDNLNMELNKHLWRDVYFSLRFNKAKKMLGLRCDYLSLDDLSGLIQTLPLDDRLKKMISTYQPVGLLRDTDIYIDNWSNVDDWYFKARFSALGLKLEANHIKLAGLGGTLSLEKDKGHLTLNSKKIRFDSKYFNQPLKVDSLAADFNIGNNEQGYWVDADNIAAQVDGVDLFARLKYQHKVKHLDLQIESAAATAAWVNRHQTDYFFTQDVVEWLDDALVSAEFSKIKLAYYGTLNAYPFAANQGVFQSSFDIRNGTLKYQPDWPAITQLNGQFSIDQDLITINADKGYIFNSRINSATTTINLQGVSHVKINGVVQSDANDLDLFFKATPLKQDYLDLVQPVDLETDFVTELNIDVPLNGEEVKVSGRASVEDAKLIVNYPRYVIDHIRGDIQFDDAFVSADKLQGVFNGKSVAASVDTQRYKNTVRTMVKAEFNSGLGALLPFGLDVSSLYKASTNWQMKLALTHDNIKNEPDLDIHIGSDLAGISLLLPAPLGKPAKQAIDFNLYFKGYEQRSDVLVFCDDKINMHLRWNETATQFWSDIRIQNGKPEKLMPGVNLFASVDSFDVKQWQASLTPFFNKKSQQSASIPLRQVNLKAANLHYEEYALASVRLNAIQENLQWKLDLESENLKAVMRFSNELSIDKPVYAAFEKLDLSSIMPEDETDDKKLAEDFFSPVNIPPLKITAKNFSFKDYFFNNLNLQTSRSRYGMTVHALDLKSKHLAVKMKGNWFINRQQKHHSSFRVDMSSENVGAMLAGFQFTKSMKRGEANAVIDWQWPAAPFDFDWKLVSGNMQLNIEDGQFVDIEPGAGRLLGMFSLSSLPKRFMLDFSDTFTEGFEFNELTSKANFLDGNLYTNKTEISGSSADIYFNGRVGLADKDYDQVMSVVPRISSGVSGWIAVLQGAAVGLTAYIGQKILGVDEAAKNQYHITGSWSEPVIKKVKSDGEEEAIDANTADESEE